MLAIAAVILLTAVNPTDASLESQADLNEIESTELELVLEEGVEGDLQTEEVVLDDSILSGEDSELIELEE